MIIKVKRTDNLVLPTRANKTDLGYDVVAMSEPNIVGNFTEHNKLKFYKSIDYIEYETNLAIAPQKDINWRGIERKFHTFAFPRSSISKYNLVLANSIGLIDNGYRHTILCRFKYIYQPEDLMISPYMNVLTAINYNKIYKKGDKIAQLVPYKNIDINFEVVDNLDETDRNLGGFGSSDMQLLKTK